MPNHRYIRYTNEIDDGSSVVLQNMKRIVHHPVEQLRTGEARAATELLQAFFTHQRLVELCYVCNLDHLGRLELVFCSTRAFRS